MKYRSYEPELIDLGSKYYTHEEYIDCLYKIGQISSIFGHDRATIKIFKKLDFKIESILDVGCGGGFFTTKLAESFYEAQVVGIDIDLNAINYAKGQFVHRSNLFFEHQKNIQLDISPKSYDIVTAMLVCHHMTDQNLVDFLISASKIAKKAIIINDLQRSRVAYIAAKILMPIMFKNRLVINDSLLSIKKSFTYSDWLFFLKRAGFNSDQYKITWQWPFRWVVTVKL